MNKGDNNEKKITSSNKVSAQNKCVPGVTNNTHVDPGQQTPSHTDSSIGQDFDSMFDQATKFEDSSLIELITDSPDSSYVTDSNKKVDNVPMHFAPEPQEFMYPNMFRFPPPPPQPQFRFLEEYEEKDIEEYFVPESPKVNLPGEVKEDADMDDFIPQNITGSSLNNITNFVPQLDKPGSIKKQNKMGNQNPPQSSINRNYENPKIRKGLPKRCSRVGCCQHYDLADAIKYADCFQTLKQTKKSSLKCICGSPIRFSIDGSSFINGCYRRTRTNPRLFTEQRWVSSTTLNEIENLNVGNPLFARLIKFESQE